MWIATIVIAFVLLIAFIVYLSITWSRVYSDGVMAYFNKTFLAHAAVFTPSLKTMSGFSNIKASAITKFVLFLIAALIDHALGKSLIPVVVFSLFTTTAFLLWIKRRKDFIALCYDDVKNGRSDEITESTYYEALLPMYRAYRALFFYQIILQVLLILL